MCHGDDDGIVMPPRIAPQQIAIIPVLKHHEKDNAVLELCHRLGTRIRSNGFRAQVDDGETRVSDKVSGSIKKGVPIRLEIGARELENGVLTIVRRDLG